MRTTSYSELLRNLSATIDGLSEDHEPALITRSGGKHAVMLMSLEDLTSYEKTRHLLHSAKNSKRMLNAIEGLEAGKGLERLR